MKNTAAVVAALAIALGSVQARADGLRDPGGLMDTGHFSRSQMISIYGILPLAYSLGFGVGARYTLPLLHDGFVPTINDSFELEFGADWAMYSYVFGGLHSLVIPAEARWSFHFLPELTAYTKLGLGWQFVFANSTFIGAYAGGFHFNFALGALWKLSQAMALRAELGYFGLKLGVGFNF